MLRSVPEGLVGSMLGAGASALPRQLLGAIVGADELGTAGIATFNAWNTTPMTATTLFCYTNVSWAATVTRTANIAAAWSGTGLYLQWSVPLAISGTTLAQVAAGSNDASFNSMAASILAARPAQTTIPIRLGWEMQDPGTFPWGVSGAAGRTSADYIAAFRRVVGLFRAVSPKFRFNWCVSWALDLGGGPIDPTPNYPGDAYVDIIGMDVYYQEQFDGQDAVAAMAYKLSANFGLNWLTSYAATHSKPISIDEWGANNDFAKPFIDGMADYFAANNVLWKVYWDAPWAGAFPTQLSDGTKPVTGAAYQARFGVATLGPNLVAHFPNYAIGGFWYVNPASGTKAAGTVVDHLPTPVVFTNTGTDPSTGLEAYDAAPPGQFEVGKTYRVRVKFNFGTSNKILSLVYDNTFKTTTVNHTSAGPINDGTTTLGPISNKSITTVGSVKWLSFDFTAVGPISTAIAYRFGPFTATAGQTITVFDMQIQKLLP